MVDRTEEIKVDRTEEIKLALAKIPKNIRELLLKNINDDIDILGELEPRKVTCCPHCGQNKFVKYGFVKCGAVKYGKVDKSQRYICRNQACKKTFIEGRKTAFFGTRKTLFKILAYIACFLETYPLRKCAELCEISLSTAFIWRHKILDALRVKQSEIKLSGTIQADELFIRTSFKGNHKKFPVPESYRLPKQRGEGDARGISEYQACIPVMISDDDLVVAKVSNLGRASSIDLVKAFTGRITGGAVLITDSQLAYQGFAQSINLISFQIPSGQRCLPNGMNIQRVNSYHNEFKRFVIHQLKGVATKYLNNYLAYHYFVNFLKEKRNDKKSDVEQKVKNNKEIENKKKSAFECSRNIFFEVNFEKLHRQYNIVVRV